MVARSEAVGIIQRTFAGGETGPVLDVRGDQVKIQTGLSLMRDWELARNGVAYNRGGTEFLGEVKDSTKATRVIEFKFNDEQAYAIEFGAGYLRFFRQGARIVIDPLSVLAWSALTTYQPGDLVIDGGVYYYAKATSLNLPPAANPGFWYAQTGLIYEVPTPYLEAQLFDVGYDQSGDQIELVHRQHTPYTLSRFAHTRWTMLPTEFLPKIDGPVLGTVTQGGGVGTTEHVYAITSAKKGNYEESVHGHVNPGINGTVTASGPTTPVTVSSAAHGLANAEVIFISAITPVGGDPNTDLQAALVSLAVPVTVVDPNTFTIDDTEGIDFTINHTLTWHKTFIGKLNGYQIQRGFAPSFVTVTWTGVPAAAEYWVYKRVNGVFGYLGPAKSTSTGLVTFKDEGLSPVLTDTPPLFTNRFVRDGKHPGHVCFWKQRLVYASSEDEPGDVWLSRAGKFRNFSVSSPIQDDDSIWLPLVGQEVFEITGLIALAGLHVFTTGSHWLIQGDSNGVVKAVPDVEQILFDGAFPIQPLHIGKAIVFMQARGSQVRELRFDLNSDGYDSIDLTAYAPHLFDGCDFVDWCYLQSPNSLVYIVRHDGMIVGLSRVAEHEIYGWFQHGSGPNKAARFESVAAVPEGPNEVCYTVVRRSIGGAQKRYVERFKPPCLKGLF